MKWNEWEPIYNDIVTEFSYNKKKDELVPLIVYPTIKNHAKIGDIEKKIRAKIVSICGPANLENELYKIKGTIIAADEAVSQLLEKNIIPDIVVTDFDGDIDDIAYASDRGSITILHAHSDNKMEIMHSISKIHGPVLLTTQNRPSENIYNFGGFTDGDRAFCTAYHFNAREINLIGFDFDHPVPKQGKNILVKMKKLSWAKKIIDMHAKE